MRSGVLGLAFFSICLSAFAQVLLRKTMQTIGPLPDGINQLPHFLLRLLQSGWFIAGISAYLISVGAWLIVLSKWEVSAAYPLVSMGFVITTILGLTVLGEHVSLVRLAGIAVICAGIMLITRTV